MTMRAARYDSIGNVVDLIHIEELPLPELRPTDVRVKINASAVNPVDDMVSKGFFNGIWSCPLPFTPGYDFAGVVEAVGDAVVDFKVGDRVAAVNWGPNRHDEEGEPIAGAFATHITLAARKVSLIPEGVSDQQAAAVALVGTTAWQVLFTAARVQAGSRVLILGGSTAVGSLAIQMAKKKGAWVATTASTRNIEYVRRFNPDLVVNYETDKWEEVVTDLDAVFDAVGDQDAWGRAERSGIIKAGGSFISIANAEVGYNPSAHPPLSFAAFLCLANSRVVLDEILSDLANGSLTIALDEEFPFTEEGLKGLFIKNAGRKSLGKNVLRFA